MQQIQAKAFQELFQGKLLTKTTLSSSGWIVSASETTSIKTVQKIW